MPKGTTITNSGSRSAFAGKLRDYFILVKFRLSFIVVFSAGIGYLFADGAHGPFWMFLLGGFLITAASNTINQIIESDTDKLMARTANRPLAAGRMQNTEAIIAAGIMAFSGIAILWFFFNALSALLGAMSLISYAFIYTPMKKVSPLAVFIGAFPGAMPPLIGCAAAEGTILDSALLLFAVQFMWQFPHFWSIAWVSYDDYAKAGFHLLPTHSGKSRSSAAHIVMYTLLTIPVSLLLYALGYTGMVSAIIVAVAGILFLYQSFRLYMSCDVKHARSLMFGSFLYLPVVLIALLMDRI
ncbi:MAG: heme o synthase [Chitinophagales bacterium]